jgi:hypothetical protein
MRSPFQFLLNLLLGVSFFPLALRAIETGDVIAWKDVAQLKNGEAAQAFSNDTREGRYGRGVATLNLQPRTEANVETANAIFEELVAEKNDDAIAIHAAYQLARIPHVQRNKPDLLLAAQRYESLIEQHPGHPLADAATVKLTILRLYAPQENPLPSERLESAKALGTGLRDPDAIRDYHIVIADAVGLMRLDPAIALQHLKKAYETSRLTGKLEADVLVRISEIAAKTGDQSLSREFARRFLKQFPRDERASSIRKKLEANS